MTPLNRLMEPSRQGHGAETASKIHYESENGRTTLCAQVQVFRVVDGEKMRVWYRTKRDVTCKSCIAKVRVMTSSDLAGLTGEQLEDIRAHIDTFRNRYGSVPTGTKPPDGRQ
jgi:hypothetical protein